MLRSIPSAILTTGFFLFIALPVSAIEEGFVPLFNGENLDGWEIMHGGDESFTVTEDGELYCPGETGYPCWLRSEKQYENFDLRFEFMIDGWTNSGFFFHAPLHGRLSKTGFEFQIYHDRNPITKTMTGGAIFGVEPPIVNAVKERDTWQQVRILMDWPYLRIWLNGQLIHDLNLEQHPELRYRLREGYFGIQDTGYNAWFRNIRVRELPDKQEWQSLFNGDNLLGWYIEGSGATWSAQDGVIYAEDNGSYLVTRDEFENFELFTYVRSDQNANGGIFFRWNTLEGRDRGNEIQIENVPDSPHPTGSLYNIVRSDPPYINAGEWFPMQIRVEGSHVVVRVNGETTVDYRGLTTIRPGHISLQMHSWGKWIEWKDIRIREL